MPESDLTIDVLRALRDVDVTAPPAEVLHARVSSAIAQEIDRDRRGSWRRLAGRRLRIARLGLMSGLVPFAAVTLTLVVFIGAIVLLHGHHQSRSPSASAAPSSPQALLSVLGVLRRPQTRADLHSPMIARYLQHPDDDGLAALNGTPDLALIRRATVTPWGSPVYLVPNKPPTSAGLARLKRQFPTLSAARLRDARREEGVTEVDRSGSGGDATVAEIEAGQAIGSEGAGRSFAGGATQTRVIAIVPDGVATVSFVDPRPPSLHRHSATVTVPVHGNVAAAQLDRGGLGGSVPIPMLWFSSAGTVIKRIGDTHTGKPTRPAWLLALSARFAVLNRPATKPTHAIAKAFELLGVAEVDLRFVHRVALSSGTVWVAPGSSQVCVAFLPLGDPEPIGATCSSSAQAKQAGVRLSAGLRVHPSRPIGPQNPLRSWHAGIVPDGIKNVRVRGNTGQIINGQVRDDAFAVAVGGGVARESK
ncbi:MAG: hypothetical protein ACRDNS_19555 [Trebonia sp.]